MPESKCHYELFAELSQQPDIDSLSRSLLQALDRQFNTQSFRLYLHNDANTDVPYVLQQGTALPDDQQHLQNLPGSSERITHAVQGDTHCWFMSLDHRPVGALMYDAAQVSDEQADAFIHNTLLIYTNLYNLLNNATLDSLTGLYNRQAFDQMMNKLLASCAAPKRRAEDPQGGETCCYFALLDIDRFKAINDNYGHLYGDEVLLHFAQLMKKSFRDRDMLFRYGGEEFAVALFVEDAATAHRILERFREQVADYHFPQIGKVTVSIGHTRVKPNQILTTVTDEADKALYYAKDNGRNQTRDYDALLRDNKLNETPASGDVELF